MITWGMKESLLEGTTLELNIEGWVGEGGRTRDDPGEEEDELGREEGK